MADATDPLAATKCGACGHDIACHQDAELVGCFHRGGRLSSYDCDCPRFTPPTPTPAAAEGEALRAWDDIEFYEGMEPTCEQLDEQARHIEIIDAALKREAAQTAALSDAALAEANVAVYPAHDVPGVWIAKFASNAYMTQGTSRTEAVVSLLDAARMVLEHQDTQISAARAEAAHWRGVVDECNENATAADAGRDARVDERDQSANPHPYNSRLYKAWERGWCEEDRDAKARTCTAAVHAAESARAEAAEMKRERDAARAAHVFVCGELERSERERCALTAKRDAMRAERDAAYESAANLATEVARCCRSSNPDFGDGYQAAVSRFEKKIRSLATKASTTLPATAPGGEEKR